MNHLWHVDANEFAKTLLPDPEQQPTMNADAVARIYGLGITKVRVEGRRYIDTNGQSGIPCVAFGRLLKYPTAAIRRHLGIDPPLEPS